MNKKIKFLTLFLSLTLSANTLQASFLWNIDFGIKKFRNNDFKEAKNYFSDYIKSNPNDKDGYWWLAKTYAKLDDVKNANENFKKSYELSSKEKNLEKINFDLTSQNSVEDYFDMATMYFEIGNLSQANTYADMMIKLDSKSSSAYFIKAKVAQIEGKTNAAKEYLNKAITFNNKLIRTNLAKSLNITELPQMTPEIYEIYALEAYFSKDILSAIKYCKKYLETNPSNIDMSNMLIDLYLKNGDLASADNLITSILSSYGENTQTILYKAKLSEFDNDKKTEEILLNAYEINPNNQQVLLEIGNYYLRKKDFTNANKYFEILINVNDKLYEAYFGYVYSLIEIGKIEEAMNLIRNLNSLNPQTTENYFLLSKICENKGNYKESLDYLTQAISKAQNPHYLLEKAKINYVFDNYKDSIKDLNLAKNISQNKEMTQEIYNYLVANYLKTKDLISAQIYLNKNSTLDKNQLMYKYNLYNLYKLQGSERIAFDTLKEIQAYNPKNPQDYIDLSEIYYDLSDFEEAIKILNKGIKKFPQAASLNIQKTKLLSRIK